MINLNEIIKYLQENTHDFQIIIGDSDNVVLQLNDNQLKSSKSTSTKVYEITVYVEHNSKIKRATQSFTNPSIDLIKMLIDIAKASEALDYFYGLPKKKDYDKASFDKNIINVDKVKDHLDIIRDKCKGLKIADSKVAVSLANINLITSQGIDSEYKSSSYSSYVSLVNGSDAFEDISFGRFAKDKEVEQMCDNVIKKYGDFKNAVKLKNNKIPVILKPDVINSLMNYAYIPNLFATNIEHKRSFLSFDDIGKELTKTKLSLIDNPFMKDASSEAFDYEGNKAYRKQIIDQGIFKTPLTNFNISKKYDLINTASASSVNSVAFSNIELQGNDSEYKDAVIIESVLGAHTSNTITTDFSVSVDKAYLIEDGKKIPVKDFFISGKMKNVLNNALFTDKQEFRGDILTKSILSEDISIIIE